jgi:hypothetical protein
MNAAIYRRRRWRNRAVMTLASAAAMSGLLVLFLILGTLLVKGVGSLSPAVFTQMTPPPGSAGGLFNAIYGSIVVTLVGTLLGTPVGILAGTYLAEFGRDTRLATVVRFINDVLLSAPSIVIGLFVYTVMVVRMGHFSAWAGGVARGFRSPGFAALGCDPQGRLSSGTRRHHHGCAPRGRAHRRRDRASAVHHAQQSVHEHRHERPDGQLAGRHFPVRAVALQGLAGAGLVRSTDHHCGGTGAEYRRASLVRRAHWE